MIKHNYRFSPIPADEAKVVSTETSKCNECGCCTFKGFRADQFFFRAEITVKCNARPGCSILLHTLGQLDPVTSIDLQGNGLEEDGGVSGMLAAVCTSLSREGSGLRVLRLGGNGAWGQEAAAALAGALASPSCVVEELDLSMCGAD